MRQSLKHAAYFRLRDSRFFLRRYCADTPLRRIHDDRRYAFTPLPRLPAEESSRIDIYCR